MFALLLISGLSAFHKYTVFRGAFSLQLQGKLKIRAHKIRRERKRENEERKTVRKKKGLNKLQLRVKSENFGIIYPCLTHNINNGV